MKQNSEALKDLIVKTLDKFKVEKVTVLNLANKTDIADYMIIATGRSTKHISSTADLVITAIKDNGFPCLSEGLNNSDWVLVDAFSVIVHIFNEEKRNIYDLEKLWSE